LIGFVHAEDCDLLYFIDMRPSTRLGSLVLRRGFASSARRLDNYGFIGLGQMVCDDFQLQ
jgi:hypothetical protein